MSAGFVAFHYPTSEHFEDFVERTHRVRDQLSAYPGYVSAETWATVDRDAVITVANFETAKQLQTAMSDKHLRAIGAFDDRERAPRKIINVTAR